MALKFPADDQSRAVSTRAKSLVVYMLNAEKWEWREQTGADRGTDMVIELAEGDEFTNKKIEAQIKGRSSIARLASGDIVFDLDVKTINYALSSSNAFVLFLVDVVKEIVYYLPIQEYFIENKAKFEAASSNSSSVRVHIPPGNTLHKHTQELCDIAKYVYIGGPSPLLRRI